MLTENQYQVWAFNRLIEGSDDKETQFIGLASEVGELMSERMREMRTDREAKGHDEILSELGDIMFYVSNIASLYDFKLNEVLAYNVTKLNSRGVKKH